MELIDRLGNKVRQAAGELAVLRRERDQLLADSERLKEELRNHHAVLRENERLRRDQERLRARLVRLNAKLEKLLLLEATVGTTLSEGAHEEHTQ